MGVNNLSESQPIRVLQVFNWFNQGGIENFVMNVYRNIDRSKIQFDFAFSRNQKGYFDDEVIEMGGRIFFFDSEKKSFWNYYKNLRRIIRENGPYNALHSHIYFFSGFILLVARLCGIDIRIAHCHETQKGRKPTFLRKCYEKLMSRLIKQNATIVLACSDAAGKFNFGNFIPYQVLYNGIDFDRFKFDEQKREEIRRDLGLSDEKLILNIGRFAEQKNHEFIIKIFKELLSRDTTYRLLLIGTGTLKNQIIDRCSSLGVLNKVIFLENIKNTEDYYSASDIFILPSLYEGMSIVAIEAQASGLPALLADNITKEVNVSELACYLPINDNASKVWASMIEQFAKQKRINRNLYSDKLRKTPFNVLETTHRLVNIYTGQK